MVLPTQAATLSDVDGSAVLPLRDVPLSGAVRTLTFRNVGNLRDLTFQVDPPVEGWSFEFEPPFVEGLPVGSTTDVQVTAIPDATAEARRFASSSSPMGAKPWSNSMCGLKSTPWVVSLG